MTKVVIPREVAEEIEHLRSGVGYGVTRDNAYIFELAMRTGGGNPTATKILRQIPFDTLLSALINGYERELTEEEKREKAITDVYQEFVYGPLRYETTAEITAYDEGILYVLNTLGIDIPGVNIPEGGAA